MTIFELKMLKIEILQIKQYIQFHSIYVCSQFEKPI